MENKRKRKQAAETVARKPKSVRAGQIQTENSKDPFPSHSAPTPQECLTIRDTLLTLHGIPPELAKYRKSQSTDDTAPPETVLDGLVRTILSQNTTESNSQKAFGSLKSLFPTWEHVGNNFVSVLFFHHYRF